MMPERHIWIFTGGGQFPGGVFSTVKLAEAWIERNGLSGTLTAYPVDQGCFDWAVENNCTGLKPEKLEAKRADAKFIGSFSTASQEHFHYLNGKPA
jgi:hypothetical protein